jgi:hypothetical protein
MSIKTAVISISIAAAIVGCASPSGGGARTRIDEVPMYGGMDRSQVPELKAGDEKFIADVVAEFGSRERASGIWVDQGFTFYRQDNLMMAMRRFNQAWLLNPNNPDVYWGFASVLNDQQKYCEGARMMDKAFSAGWLQPSSLPDAAVLYVGCTVQDPSLSPEAKDAMLRRSEELFEKAYASQGVTKKYTLYHWARAMYGRGDYAKAWLKVSEYERISETEFPREFKRNLSLKMPEPK